MPTAIIENFIRSEILDAKLQFQLAKSFRFHQQLLQGEARKRGWATVPMDDGIIGVYNQTGDPVGTFQKMLTSATSSSAVAVCARKHVARKHFQRTGVPVAEGETFSREEKEQAADYVTSRACPVVMKPDRGAGGTNVVTDVITTEDFEKAWKKIFSGKKAGAKIVIEDQFSGIDIRVMVVGGKYVATSSRIPGFVVGDGDTTFGELVKASQIERNNNAYLKRMPSKPDYEWLSRIGISDDTVLAAGKIQVLSLVYNLHQGGINVDVTGHMPAHFIDIAETAAKSIPGLSVAGIDLMVTGLNDGSEAIVLEANTSANIAVHHYPAYGKAVNVAEKILDLMDPTPTIP